MLFVSESEESNNDHEPMGGAVLVWLQTPLGTQRIRRGFHAARPIRPHLETRHCALQQVRPPPSFLIPAVLFVFHKPIQWCWIYDHNVFTYCVFFIKLFVVIYFVSLINFVIDYRCWVFFFVFWCATLLLDLFLLCIDVFGVFDSRVMKCCAHRC